MKISLLACLCVLLGVVGGIIIGRKSAAFVKIDGIGVVVPEGVPSADLISTVNGEMHQRIVEIVGSDRPLHHLVVVAPATSGFEVYMIGPSDSKIWKTGIRYFSGRIHERMNELRSGETRSEKKDLE